MRRCVEGAFWLILHSSFFFPRMDFDHHGAEDSKIATDHLRIYSSQEGRCLITAAAFTKGFLVPWIASIEMIDSKTESQTALVRNQCINLGSCLPDGNLMRFIPMASAKGA